ncbi:MAG: hypothetical protein ACLP9L_11580 [Thermoguttaceae bacterium]
MRQRLSTRTGSVASYREYARHRLTFDSDDPATFTSRTLPAPLASKPSAASPLPACDYLVVTWTVEEAKCLADTLTPGFASNAAWYPYAHNFASEYAALIRPGAPAQESKRLGSYFPTTIAGKKVLCFKSELHMSQDGPKMPVARLWGQLIAEARPKLVITTGTAGGIGAAVELGDVVVPPAVQFDYTREFKAAAFHDNKYACSKLKTTSPPTEANLVFCLPHMPPALPEKKGGFHAATSDRSSRPSPRSGPGFERALGAFRSAGRS